MSTSSNGDRAPIPPNNNPDLPTAKELPIIQTQALLNTLEKELKRDLRLVRYYYGQHFPELAAIIKDGILYSRVVRRIGRRQNISNVDLSDLLTPGLISQVVNAANNSRGREMSDEEMEDVYALCDRIPIHLNNRVRLMKIIQMHMENSAPYMTGILGAQLGAKTLYRASTFLGLAQQQASQPNGPGGDQDNAGEGPSRGLGAAGAVNSDGFDEDDEQLAPKQGAEEDADYDSD